MRALTLTQPWAGLVASGHKLVENRPRPMIKREDFGKPFAIHASRVVDREAWRRIIELAPELALDYPGPMAARAGFHRIAEVTSAIVGVATISGIVKTGPADIDFCDANSQAIMALGEDQRRWFFGPIGYVLRDVVALERPIPCRGFQGFWTLTPELERAVLEQYDGCPRCGAVDDCPDPRCGDEPRDPAIPTPRKFA